MNLYEKRIWVAFTLTLLLTLFGRIIDSSLNLLFFAPFLVITYYQKSLPTCLGWSMGCGAVLDLLAPYPHFGVYALCFSAATLLLYGRKHRFFVDRLSTLPLMTFFFSILVGIFHLMVVNLFEQRISPSWQWAKGDLLVMPFFDALYAFTLFILPFFLFGKRPKKGKDYFNS